METLPIFLARQNKYAILLKVLQQSKEPILEEIFVYLFDVDRYIAQQNFDENCWEVIIACYILLTQKFRLSPTMESLVVLFESVYFLPRCKWDPKFQIADSKTFVRKLLANFSVEELNADFTFRSKYQNLAHCIACQMPDYLMLFQGFDGDIFVRINGKNLLEYAVRSQYISMDVMEMLYLSGLDIDPSLQKFLEDEQLTIQMQRFKSLQI